LLVFPALFSGGPVLDADGKIYDCGVRLMAGTRGSGSTLPAGDGISSGRVEVKHNGVWGSVCSLGWDDDDANVLCRSIGFAGGIAYTSNSAEACVAEDVSNCDALPGPGWGTAVWQGDATYPDDYPTEQCWYCTGSDTCNLKITAKAALNGAQASFKVSSEGRDLFDAAQFSSDYQEITQSFSGLPTGSQTVTFFDTGSDGWWPLTETVYSPPRTAIVPSAIVVLYWSGVSVKLTDVA
jgi:hypothetical protein